MDTSKIRSGKSKTWVEGKSTGIQLLISTRVEEEYLPLPAIREIGEFLISKGEDFFSQESEWRRKVCQKTDITVFSFKGEDIIVHFADQADFKVLYNNQHSYFKI